MLSDIAKAVARGKIRAFCKVERTPLEIQKAINRNSIYYVELDELETLLRQMQNEGLVFLKRGTWCIYEK